VSATLARATLTGAALSVGIETLQAFSPVRTSSMLDVFTNTTGALIGASSVVGMAYVARRLRGWKSYVGLPALSFAGPMLVATFFDAVFLSRPEPLSGVYGGPGTRFLAAMEHFEWASISALPVLDLILFVPLGAFAVAALAELGRGHSRAAREVALGGVVLSIAVEVTRGALALPMELGAILVHTAGIALGAWAAAHWLPVLSRRLRGRHRPLALAAMYSIMLALWSWKPFRLETDVQVILSQLSPSRLVPLHAHGWRVDLFSVGDVVVPFFLYLPLGSLLAVWPVRLRGALGYCLPAVYFAILAEFGQVLVATRHFGITDVLVQCAAVGIGWAIMQRAGFRPHGEMLPGLGR
jgi:glycopeptide antibiotics resistance protein